MAIYRMQVVSTFPIGSLRGVNTFHFRSPAITVPGPQSIITLIKNFYDAIKVYFPTTTVFNFDGNLTEVATATPAATPLATPFTVTGTVTGSNYSPAGVGLCVGWRSSLATRRGRGRTFLSPLASVLMEPSTGTITDANLAAIRTAAGNLVTGSLADGNGALTVFSPSDNQARDVVSYKINDKVAWLSSRRG